MLRRSFGVGGSGSITPGEPYSAPADRRGDPRPIRAKVIDELANAGSVGLISLPRGHAINSRRAQILDLGLLGPLRTGAGRQRGALRHRAPDLRPGATWGNTESDDAKRREST